MTDVSPKGTEGAYWGIEWAARRTWVKFLILTIALAVALVLAIFPATFVLSNYLRITAGPWLGTAFSVLMAIMVWIGCLYLLKKSVKYPSRVDSLNVLEMDPSLKVSNRIFILWFLTIFFVHAIFIHFLLPKVQLDQLIEMLFYVIFPLITLVSFEDELIRMQRRLLGAELEPDLASASAMKWQRIGPASIAFNILLCVTLLFVVLGLLK